MPDLSGDVTDGRAESEILSIRRKFAVDQQLIPQCTITSTKLKAMCPEMPRLLDERLGDSQTRFTWNQSSKRRIMGSVEMERSELCEIDGADRVGRRQFHV